jgi:hypothetical protein
MTAAMLGGRSPERTREALRCAAADRAADAGQDAQDDARFGCRWLYWSVKALIASRTNGAAGEPARVRARAR